MRAGPLQTESAPVGVWTFLNRVLVTLIVITALSVMLYRFLPETGRRKEGAAKVAALIDQVEKQKQLLARAKREAELITRDTEYLEIIARDRLDLMKEGEKVYRLDQDAPPATGGAKKQGSGAR